MRGGGRLTKGWKTNICPIFMNNTENSRYYFKGTDTQE